MIFPPRSAKISCCLQHLKPRLRPAAIVRWGFWIETFGEGLGYTAILWVWPLTQDASDHEDHDRLFYKPSFATAYWEGATHIHQNGKKQAKWKRFIYITNGQQKNHLNEKSRILVCPFGIRGCFLFCRLKKTTGVGVHLENIWVQAPNMSPTSQGKFLGGEVREPSGNFIGSHLLGKMGQKPMVN